MNKTNFKQYDTRWASLGYPKKPWYIKQCGCGEVAIANCIIEMEKYKNETPKTIQPYCKQFAAPNGDGTYFSGIPKMMKHYGMTDVMEHPNMQSLWKEMKKGNRVAIFLMGNRRGGSKGIHWTSSAHFIAGVKYSSDGKTHKFYIKDSNSSSPDRNGWLSYEAHLKNDVSRVWSGKLATPSAPTPTPTPTKTVDEIAKEVLDGKWGNGDERVERLKAAGYDPTAVQKRVNELLAPKKSIDELAQEVINGEWGSGDERKKRLTDAGYDYEAVQKKVNELLAPKEQTNAQKIATRGWEYAYHTNASDAKYSGGKPKAAYKAALDTAFGKTRNWQKAAKVGASCDVFIATCIRMAGIDKSAPRGLGRKTYFDKSDKFKRVSVTTKTVQDGDIISIVWSNGKWHWCMAYGGKVLEASLGGFYPKTTNTLASRLSLAGKKSVVVYRAK